MEGKSLAAGKRMAAEDLLYLVKFPHESEEKTLGWLPLHVVQSCPGGTAAWETWCEQGRRTWQERSKRLREKEEEKGKKEKEERKDDKEKEKEKEKEEKEKENSILWAVMHSRLSAPRSRS